MQDVLKPNSAQRMVAWLEEAIKPLEDPTDIVRAVFPADGYDTLVMVNHIEFASICEHHLLPFTGKATVGYLPGDFIIGLSKLARLVEWASSRASLQEAITTRIAEALEYLLKPRGVMVVLYDCEHTCMSVRGVKARHARTTTSAVRGIFKDAPAARAEFLALMKA